MANILLVDPDNNAYQALKGFLGRGVHRSSCVSNAQDAMAFLRENILVDLIIAELKLDNSTGLGLLETLRGDYFFGAVPVVFYAAKPTHDDIQDAYEFGVQSIHRKPYLENLIQDEIARVEGKEWYWEFFEADDVFCERTGLSLDQRSDALDELISAVKSAAPLFKETAEKILQNPSPTVSGQEEKQHLLREITALRQANRSSAVSGLEELLKLLATFAGRSLWGEFKNAVGALDYYAILMGYRADAYKLDRMAKQAAGVLDRLAQNAVLRSLPPREVHSMIPHLRDSELEAGTTLFKQGDPGDAMYLVEQGRLGVYLENADGSKPKKIGEICDGGIVGEMALIKNAPRSATIIAEAHTRMMRMEKDAFHRVILQSPQMKHAVQALAEQRSMESITQRAGEIDISVWSKTACEGFRKTGQHIPKGFLGNDEKNNEDLKRETLNIERWNKMVDSQSFPVVSSAQILREIGALKSCPVIGSAAAAFAQATGGITVSLHPVMDLVEHDPGLAFQALQIANSVRQAKKKDTVTFIDDARMCVNYLGEKKLAGIAKGMPRCSESFMYLDEEANWQTHLKFLLATANIARFACDQMEFPHLEPNAFLAALLHDIGKLLFLRVQPAGFVHVYLHAEQNNLSIAESEKLHMEISSRQMAIEFVEKKSLPKCFKNVIRWVEQPDQATEDAELVAVVAIARYLCRLCKVGFSAEVDTTDLLPLEQTQLWDSFRGRVFPSFSVSNFEALVRRKLENLS